MAAGLEVAAADEWLDSVLNGDATLSTLLSGNGFWNTQPEQQTPFPHGVFQMMSANDYAAVGAYRIWANLTYLVKVIGRTGNYDALNAAVARVDALLHRASGTAADGTVWSCVREQVIRMPEDVSGDQFRHSGAMYRLYAT